MYPVNMYQPRTRLLSALLLLLCTQPCLAERADRDKPVHLDADQVLIDDGKQTSTFTGNVRLTQGTMRILGDRIVVVQDKDGFKHGTAYGKPASYRQKREGLNEYVEGYGNRIEYDTRDETVDFYGQARIQRNQDEVRGDYINYNAKTEIFKVNGSQTTTADASPKRVHAVLQPKPKDDAARPDTRDLPAPADKPQQPAN